MTKKKPGGETALSSMDFRKRAEALALEKSAQFPESQKDLSPEETRRALHELRVHQIELEMQNEELRRIQVALDASRVRYFDLYDLAPVGYCTVSEAGLILEANLTAANLLGAGRGTLVTRPISQFILKEDQDLYYLHRKKLQETGQLQAYELRIKKNNGAEFWALFEATATRDADGAPVSRIVMSDISRIKRAENELRQSEARARIVTDFTYDWEYWLGPDGRFEYVSPSAERVTGRSVSAGAIAEDFLRLVVHPEDLERVLGHFQKQLTCHGFGDMDFRILRSDGEVRWIAHVCQTISDAQGRFLGVRGSNRDVTDRKRLERELAQANEAQFTALVENLPSKVFLRDRNSVYLSCNENYASDLKIRPEEIAGKTDYDFFPTQLAEKYRADDKRIMDAGKTESREEEYHRIEDYLLGSPKAYIRIVKAPIRDKSGNVTGILGLFWDITELREAEAALANKTLILEASSQVSIDGMLVVDAAGRVLFMNKCFGELWRIPQAILDSKEDAPMLASIMEQVKDPAAFKARINYLYAHQGEKSRDEIELVDGRSLDRYSAPLAGSDGRYFGRIWYFRDITERKVAEIEIRSAELLKNSSEIKSKFASMVSHELRSPLAIIQGGLDLISDGLCGEVNEEQKKILEMSQKSVERLGRLINNVLDFQKIESGKMEYDFRDHDLKETVQEASKSLMFLAAPKGLELLLKFGEGLPVIKFDKDKILQVLTNLVSNGIKFTPAGSVTLSVHRKNNEMCVEIRDTGPGIPAEDIARLFQPFVQLDAERGRAKGGTGLGLAISREIVLAHGGRIWAESEMGRGSAFHFTLPVHERRGTP